MAKKATQKNQKSEAAEIMQELTGDNGMVEAYNDANQSGNVDEALKLDAEMRQKVNRYTAIKREECFTECAAAEDPVLEAARRLTFGTIAIKDSKVESTVDGVTVKIPVRTIEPKDKAIDLLKLHKFVKDGIGQDKNWNAIVEKFNFTLTCQTARDLGINPKSVNDSYAMSEIAKEYDLGKNPASKTNLLKTLNAITMALVGEGYKASTHDVNYLLKVYNKKDNKAKLTVSCANHNYLRAYVLDILHRIVCEESYAVSYKAKKN